MARPGLLDAPLINPQANCAVQSSRKIPFKKPRRLNKFLRFRHFCIFRMLTFRLSQMCCHGFGAFLMDSVSLQFAYHSSLSRLRQRQTDLQMRFGKWRFRMNRCHSIPWQGSNQFGGCQNGVCAIRQKIIAGINEQQPRPVFGVIIVCQVASLFPLLAEVRSARSVSALKLSDGWALHVPARRREHPHS